MTNRELNTLYKKFKDLFDKINIMNTLTKGKSNNIREMENVMSVDRNDKILSFKTANIFFNYEMCKKVNNTKQIVYNGNIRFMFDVFCMKEYSIKKLEIFFPNLYNECTNADLDYQVMTKSLKIYKFNDKRLDTIYEILSDILMEDDKFE